MFGSRKPTTTSTQAIPSVTATSSTPSTTAPAVRPQPPVGFETVFGAHTTLKGELKSSANVRIEGKFEGSVEVEGNVMVGETANILANIHGYNLLIAGNVHGNLIGHKIQIQRTGRVWGDLSAASIVTEEGAFIEGKITMHSHPAAKGDEPQALPVASLVDSDPGMESVDADVLDDQPTAHEPEAVDQRGKTS